MYALCCDADFYVFVEQDCLLYGSDFLNRAVANSRDDILLGRPTEGGKGLNGSIAAPMLQNALMIVRRTGIERFIDAMLGAPWTDGEVAPEETMKRRISPLRINRHSIRPVSSHQFQGADLLRAPC
jgi:hypothetical protein